MIDGLKPYPAYKDSGVPWLGNIPEQWNVCRIKNLLNEIDCRSSTGSERLLSLRMRRGLVDHIQVGGKPIACEDLVGFKLVDPGSMVMNRMRAANGLFGIAPCKGIVSPDYAVFTSSPLAIAEYYLHLFKTPCMGNVFRSESKGLGTGEAGFLRLYTDRFGAIAVPLPPVNEQSAISRFVRYANRRIEPYIRAKRKAIALLSEQKATIIHFAITRGLDPRARMKRSTVEWLDEIPDYWKMRRFKFLCRINKGQIDPRSSLHSHKILIAPNHIERGTGRLRPLETAEAQGADSGKYLVKKGQIIYSKIRPALRKAAIAPIDCLCSADMYPISLNESEILPSFCLYLYCQKHSLVTQLIAQCASLCRKLIEMH